MQWNKDTIYKCRKERKLKQYELAELVGCRQQTVSEWEVGRYTPGPAYTKLLNQWWYWRQGAKNEVDFISDCTKQSQQTG